MANCVMNLKGKRLVVQGIADEHRKFSKDYIKRLTGCDSISGRHSELNVRV